MEKASVNDTRSCQRRCPSVVRTCSTTICKLTEISRTFTVEDIAVSMFPAADIFGELSHEDFFVWCCTHRPSKIGCEMQGSAAAAPLQNRASMTLRETFVSVYFLVFSIAECLDIDAQKYIKAPDSFFGAERRWHGQGCGRPRLLLRAKCVACQFPFCVC